MLHVQQVLNNLPTAAIFPEYHFLPKETRHAPPTSRALSLGPFSSELAWALTSPSSPSPGQ